MDQNREHANRLFDILHRRFNASELKTLCFRLGTDFDSLPGEGFQDKARELVGHYERRNNLEGLANAISEMRSDITGNNEANNKHNPSNAPRLCYDSRNEMPPIFTSFWEHYVSAGTHSDRIKKISRASDRLPTLEFIAYGNEDVGSNKHIPSVKGKADFEYQAIMSQAQESNLVIYIIPVQLNWLDPEPHRTEQLLRKKLTIPKDHIGDHTWHRASIDFDFRDFTNIYFSIFSPRINEGCLYPGAARLLISNIQLYAH